MTAGDRPPGEVQRPASAGEAAALLAVASREGRPVRIVGGASGAGEVGARDPLILSTEALRGVVEYEPADLTLTAGAGEAMADLDRHTRQAGQWLPVDASGWRGRTLGGLVAGGRWGPLRSGYGAPREHVLGATLVTGDGRIVTLGGRVVKNVAGFDVLRAVVGSRGTLGMITEVTVRLHPVPPTERTLLFPSTSAVDLHTLALELGALPTAPAALELFGPGIPGVTADGGVRDGGGVLALRLQGGEGPVGALGTLAVDLAGGGRGGRRAPRVDALDGSASEAFWERSAQSGSEVDAWIRFSVLPSLLPDLAGRLLPLVASARGWWSTHGTVGVIRVVVPRLPGEDPLGEAVMRPLDAVIRWTRAAGGSVHPGGMLLRASDPSGSRRAGLAAGIRRVFDPAGILVPGPRRHA